MVVESLDIPKRKLDLASHSGRSQHVDPSLPSDPRGLDVSLFDQVAHQEIRHAESDSQAPRQVALADLGGRVYLFEQPELSIGVAFEVTVAVVVAHAAKLP